MKIFARAAWVVVCMVVAMSARAGAPKRQSLVVLDLVAEQGVSDGTVRLLNELLLTEFQRTGQYNVFGGSDIKAMLANAQQQQKLGCTETECLVELGGALGADWLASANIGRVGDFFLLNVKILDIRERTVVSRWSTQIEGIENKLMTAVRDSVAGVTAAAQPRAAGGPAPSVIATAPPAVPPGVTEVHAATVVAPSEHEPPAARVRATSARLPWISLGGVVAAGLTGGVFGVLAKNEASAARREFAGTSSWQAHRDAMASRALVADIGFGIALVTGIASGVLFALDAQPQAAASAP